MNQLLISELIADFPNESTGTQGTNETICALCFDRVASATGGHSTHRDDARNNQVNETNLRRNLGLVLGALCLLSPAPAGVGRQEVPGQFGNVVNEAWETINTGYYDPSFGGADWAAIRREFVSKEYRSAEEANAAIRQMLERLNSPATRFLTKEQVTAFLNEVSVRPHVGTGLLELLVVDIDERSRKLQIVTTVPNTPARRAGLQPGDLIAAINGVETDGLGLSEAMEKLRGPEMTAANLTIQRSEKRFEVRLVRQNLPAIERSVQAEARQWRGQCVGYIRLDLFLETSVEQMREAVRKLEEEGVSGLLLDLRNNPGGDLRSCLRIAGIFLGDAPLVNVKGRDGVKPLRALGEQFTKLPMNILVDKGTASAAELLAAGLQAHQRAAVIGETTYGKGFVHRAAQLSDGSLVLMPSGSLWTLKGDEILGRGITPDVVVNPSSGTDEQWNKAVELLLRSRPATDMSPPAKISNHKSAIS